MDISNEIFLQGIRINNKYVRTFQLSKFTEDGSYKGEKYY